MKNNNANYTRILIDIWKQDEDKNCNEGTFFFWVWDVPPNLRDRQVQTFELNPTYQMDTIDQYMHLESRILQL